MTNQKDNPSLKETIERWVEELNKWELGTI